MPFSNLVVVAWIAKEKDRTLAGVLAKSDCECSNGFHYIFRLNCSNIKLSKFDLLFYKTCLYTPRKTI